MTQQVDFQFRERLESRPVNERFRDITGAAVLHGFKLVKGSSNFSLTLTRDGYNDSVAITPSGAKIIETTDLVDIVTLEPNTSSSGLPRVDGLYLVYQHGSETAIGRYVVVKGANNNVAPSNPNLGTHLLLGHVQVFPNSEPIAQNMITPVTPGFSKLEIAGSSNFHGPAEFDKPVVFKGPVTFQDGTSGGSGGGGSVASTFYDALPTPIIALAGQKDFTLPSKYAVGRNALFVYLDRKLLPRSAYVETSDTTFRLTNAANQGQEVDAYWYNALAVYTPAAHTHDERYYQKYEMANRMLKTVTDYFNGPNGRTVTHNLGHKNYDVVSIVPTEKTSSVGTMSVEIGDNDIKVYNDGSYRGKFTVSYQVRNSLDYTPTPEHLGEYSVFSKDLNTTANVYTKTEYRRKNGTLYALATLSAPNASNQFTNVTVQYFNSDGSKAIRTELWALTYDVDGRVVTKALQTVTV